MSGRIKLICLCRGKYIKTTAKESDFSTCFPAGCEKVFENIDSDIDYVINLASETRKGQSEPVYREGIQKLSTNVIQYVVKYLPNIKTYVEFSTGSLYPDGKVN